MRALSVRSVEKHINGVRPVILCVAEKPSLAIAGFLASGGEYGTRAGPHPSTSSAHLPRAARLSALASRATCSLDFEQQYQSWDRPPRAHGADGRSTVERAWSAHTSRGGRLRPSRPLPRLRPRGRTSLEVFHPAASARRAAAGGGGSAAPSSRRSRPPRSPPWPRSVSPMSTRRRRWTRAETRPQGRPTSRFLTQRNAASAASGRAR